jgi:hypothetical protein
MFGDDPPRIKAPPVSKAVSRAMNEGVDVISGLTLGFFESGGSTMNGKQRLCLNV